MMWRGKRERGKGANFFLLALIQHVKLPLARPAVHIWGWCGQLSLVSSPVFSQELYGGVWIPKHCFADGCIKTEIQSFNAMIQMLHHCVPVSLLFRWPTVLWTQTSHLGTHSGNGICPHGGKYSGVKSYSLFLLFLLIAPSCQWGKAQLFLLTCIRCSLKALRFWSLFILVCSTTSPRQALISAFRAALVSLLKLDVPKPSICLHMVFCLLLKHTLKIQKVATTSGLKVPYGATSPFWDY